jgi:hypothetical protein
MKYKVYLVNNFNFVVKYNLHIFNAKRFQKTSRSEPLKIKIPSKNMREKPTNTPIIRLVY